MSSKLIILPHSNSQIKRYIFESLSYHLNRTRRRNEPIHITRRSIVSDMPQTWEKEEMEGNDLPYTRWIFAIPKNQSSCSQYNKYQPHRIFT